MAKQLGQALREARLERGIDLTEVERVTKIRVKFLRAMEEDRWDELPAPAYARSFLQTYARYLDLDDEPLVERYRKDIEPKQGPGPIPSGVIHPGTLEPRRSLRPLALVLGGLGAVAAVVLVVAAIGSIGGSGNGGGGTDHPQRHPATSTSAGNTASTTTTTTGSELSVQLTPTADVWVCLVDDRGRQLVNGQTLASGEVSGPFTAAGFELTLGNGSVEMTVDGQPADIPASASPLNYRITPSGLKQLASGAGPTCT